MFSAVKGFILLVSLSSSLLITTHALAEKEIAIFSVRRQLAMNNNDKMPRDFYVNAGREAGIKPGMIITVNRKLNLYDPLQNNSPGELRVPVGEILIIAAQKGVSVARANRVFSRENLPSLENDFIMVGDLLDIGTARSAPKKSSMVPKTRKMVPMPSLQSPKANDQSFQLDFSSVMPLEGPGKNSILMPIVQ